MPPKKQQTTELGKWIRELKRHVPWWVFVNESVVPTLWVTAIFTAGVLAAEADWVLGGYIVLLVGGIGYSLGLKASQENGGETE